MKRNRYIIAYVLLAFCFIKHPVVGQNRSFTGTVTLYRNGYGVGRCKDEHISWR